MLKERVESGEIVDIGYAVMTNNGCFSTGFSSENPTKLLAASSQLQYRINAYIDRYL